MMLISIKSNLKIPVHQQIIGQVMSLVDSGTLVPGERLPASRVLAKKLNINRSTVTNAYEELIALGYLKSSPGSYTTVCQRQKIAQAESKSLKSNGRTLS